MQNMVPDTGINKIEEIEITESSYPFASAMKYCPLEEEGYYEKEYYMYGNANVYQTNTTGEIEVKTPQVPYVNRFVVRVPQDKSRFSGNVIMEIINPTANMDLDRMWILGYKQFLRQGDIYIGITSKPNTLAKMAEFNPVRYQKLSWPNPTPEVPFPEISQEQMGNITSDLDISYETGLFWDMLTDLAIYLRKSSVNNPVGSYQPGNFILTGWSQSACYSIRYINDFAYKRDIGFDVFDGYLVAGAPREVLTPVNQYEAKLVKKSDRVRIKEVRNPCIVLQTESENGLFSGYEVVKEVGNDQNFACRYYDVTGASHDTKYSLLDYYQQDPDLKRIDMLPEYSGRNQYPNNYPLQILVAAAFRNLTYWVNEGVAPEICDPILTDYKGNNKKDAFGNSIGGLRTCLLDYPTGRYYHASDIEKGRFPMNPEIDKNPLFGYEEPFSREMLSELYGSLAAYRQLVESHTYEQVTRGFIVKEDAAELIEIAVQLAEQRGLADKTEQHT